MGRDAPEPETIIWRALGLGLRRGRAMASGRNWATASGRTDKQESATVAMAWERLRESQGVPADDPSLLETSDLVDFLDDMEGIVEEKRELVLKLNKCFPISPKAGHEWERYCDSDGEGRQRLEEHEGSFIRRIFDAICSKTMLRKLDRHPQGLPPERYRRRTWGGQAWVEAAGS